MDKSQCFRDFILELSNRLADEPDYEDKLQPKFIELLNMTRWVIGEAWENGLGGEVFNNKMKGLNND